MPLCACGCDLELPLKEIPGAGLGYRKYIKGHQNRRVARQNIVTWKGDSVSRRELHAWVAKWKERTDICSHCGRERMNGERKFDWANVDHEYHRCLDDFIELCQSCHRKMDYAKGFISQPGMR